MPAGLHRTCSARQLAPPQEPAGPADWHAASMFPAAGHGHEAWALTPRPSCGRPARCVPVVRAPKAPRVRQARQTLLPGRRLARGSPGRGVCRAPAPAQPPAVKEAALQWSSAPGAAQLLSRCAGRSPQLQCTRAQPPLLRRPRPWLQRCRWGLLCSAVTASNLEHRQPMKGLLLGHGIALSWRCLPSCAGRAQVTPAPMWGACPPAQLHSARCPGSCTAAVRVSHAVA